MSKGGYNQLSEPISSSAAPDLPAVTRSGESIGEFATNVEDAKRRVYELLQREQAAKAAGASDLERLQTYILPALEALADVGADQSLRDLTMQFEGLLNQLKFGNTPEIASSLDCLASLYADQGRYGEAEPLYQQALNIRQTQLGIDHLSTATSLNNLAGLYQSQGRYAEAEPLYLRALDICERQLGAEHPDTASSLNSLGSFYVERGNFEAAIPLLLRSLAIHERVLGDSHPYTQDTRQWLERAQAGE